MTPEERPDAPVFDPASAGIPPNMGTDLLEPSGPILLIVAADNSVAARRTAVAMATARASAGRPTVLGDAAVADPRLHQLLDVDNVEGLADVFLFGASLEHVRRGLDHHPFDFVSTGAYVPEPRAVLDSPRWEGIADEVRASDSLLLLFVPASTPGVGPLSRRVPRAVIVGDEPGVERVKERLDRSCEVLSVVHPPEWALEAAARKGEAVGGAASEERALSEPPVFRPERRKRPLVSPLLLIALLVALAAGGWFVYEEYVAEQPASLAAGTAGPAAPPVAERGEAVETPVPISVVIEVHPEWQDALARVRTVRQQQPELTFFLAPAATADTVPYYRLFAGPVETREAGAALMQQLVEQEIKTAFDTWAIQPTDLAFHLGEYDTRREAEARLRALEQQQVPAYIVPIPHPPGPPRYRVYGGGYRDEGEARVMRDMLEQAGIEAELEPRTGQPLAVPTQPAGGTE